MKLVVQIGRCHVGSYQPPTRPNSEAPRPRAYTILSGTTENGEGVKAAAWDHVGFRLGERIQGLLQPDEDIASRRIILDCDGHWNTRATKAADGSSKVDHKFIIKSFTILNGPSLEAARTRFDAGVALSLASKMEAEGDIVSANLIYKRFVASVARCTLPSDNLDTPSADVADAPEEVANEGPEEAAQRRFQEADAARGVTASTAEPDASEAAVDEQVNPASEGVSEEVQDGAKPEVIEAVALDESDDQTFGNEEADSNDAVQASQPETVASEPEAAPEVATPAMRPLPGRRPPPPRRMPSAAPGLGM